MALTDLAGATYGPFSYRADPEKVGEFAGVVGAGRAGSAAPRSLVGALLFVVTPHLLSDPRAAGATRSVIHGDQSFAWHAPVPLGVELAVSGTVTRVRERAGVYFTGFDLEVSHAGAVVVTGSSVFLMSGEGVTPVTGGVERAEPAPDDGSSRRLHGTLGSEQAVIGSFGASRSDLVRYAGASRDWNPIHWDHASAVAAGLPGIVVHGLLQSAWITESAVTLGMNVTSARFRYRRPLGAGVGADLVGGRTETGAAFELRDGDGPYVTASVE